MPHRQIRRSGKDPLVYTYQYYMVYCVPRDVLAQIPSEIGPFKRVLINSSPVPPATDDWPYLYLSSHRIPLDYLVVIGALILLSVLCVRSAGMGSIDAEVG